MKTRRIRVDLGNGAMMKKAGSQYGTITDNELETMMQEMLAGRSGEALNLFARIWEKRDGAFINEVEMPCNLSKTLSDLRKVELDQIRKTCGISGLSGLKKEELARALQNTLPVKVREEYEKLDAARLSLLRRVHDAGGSAPDPGLALRHLEDLRDRGLLFTGLHEGIKVQYLPLELDQSFARCLEDGLDEIVRRNTRWLEAAYGLLHYNGVLRSLVLHRMVERSCAETIPMETFLEVMSSAQGWHGKAVFDQGWFHDPRVLDPARVRQEHRMRESVEYHRFSFEELRAATNGEAADAAPQQAAVITLIRGVRDLRQDEAKEICRELNNLILNGAGLQKWIEYLNDWIAFPSEAFLNRLVQALSELNRRTRQWFLKGHCPGELFDADRNAMNPLPVIPFPATSAADPLDWASAESNGSMRIKTGRNDPCPCGSGKKFKKCCGR